MIANRDYWTKIPSKILKSELAKRDISYIELVKKLHELGVEIKVEDLRGRLARGTFSAMLFVQCLRAIDVKSLSFEDSFFEQQ